MSATLLSKKRTPEGDVIQQSNKRLKAAGIQVTRVKNTAPVGKRRRNPIDAATGLSQCYKKVAVYMYVSVAPMYFTDPLLGVRVQHLNPLIMSYFPDVSGVVLSYSNLKLDVVVPEDEDIVPVARIANASPFAFTWISVDLLVWAPCAGDIVDGWVNLQSPGHIGLLINDTFNASVRRDSIPRGWKFVAKEADELDKENGDNASGLVKSLGYWQDEQGNMIDGKLKFTVKSLQVSGKVISVNGSLVKPGSERGIKAPSPSKNHSNPIVTGKKIKFDDEVNSTVSEADTVGQESAPAQDDSDADEVPSYAPNDADSSDSEEDDSDDVVTSGDEEDDSDSD